MGTFGRIIHNTAIAVAVAAVGMVGTAEGEFLFSGDCAADWCENDRVNAYAKAEWLQLVDEQLAELGCDKDTRLTDTVAVVPQQYSKAQQAFGFARHDLAVVTLIPFDEAWVRGQAGEVSVVGWCG